MSERTYAPRSGGRTAEQRIGDGRVGEARVGEPGRRPPAGTEGDVRGARRHPAQAVPGRAHATSGRTAAGRTAAGRAASGRAASGRDASDRGRRTAPVQGTAALKLNPAVAEPLRVTDTAATAPRLRVAPPAPISAPRAPFIAVVIALVIAGVIGILLINTKTNENSFEISRLQDQQTALDNRQQQLENQLAVYDSVGNLDAAAKRLGLVKADAPAYIRLPDGKVIGVPKPGTGRPAVTAQDADDEPVAGNQATAPQGQDQSDQAQSGQVQSGQVQSGQAQSGQAQRSGGQPGAAQPGAVAPDTGE